MPSIASLLGPGAKNRELRAFAFLHAKFLTGSRTAVDCLTPLVVHVLALNKGKQFLLEEAASAVEEHFRIHLAASGAPRKSPT
jgi:hypothetical protein